MGRSYTWVDNLSGCQYIGLGLPHVHEPPSHLLSTYDTSYGVSMLCGATGCWAWGSRTDDIFLEGVGRSPNRRARVRVSHCAGWQALQRLPCPHGNFLRGHLASTTSFRSTSLGKQLKQWDRAYQLCIQCFEAIDTLFVTLTMCYSTLALGVQ